MLRKQIICISWCYCNIPNKWERWC